MRSNTKPLRRKNLLYILEYHLYDILRVCKIIGIILGLCIIISQYFASNKTIKLLYHRDSVTSLLMHADKLSNQLRVHSHELRISLNQCCEEISEHIMGRVDELTLIIQSLIEYFILIGDGTKTVLRLLTADLPGLNIWDQLEQQEHDLYTVFS